MPCQGTKDNRTKEMAIKIYDGNDDVTTGSLRASIFEMMKDVPLFVLLLKESK